MAIVATKDHLDLRVVHPSWCGREVYGTIVGVPNAWHVDLSTMTYGVIRAAQSSVIWQQDWKGAR